MTNKIYYLNDEKHHVTVTVIDGTNDGFYRLAPLEDIYIQVNIPKGHTLYVKKWEGRILFSHIPDPGPSVRAA